jgi:hypothetical protein
LPHDHDELGLDDVELAREPCARLLLVAPGELDAVRPVDRGRIDVEPLQRLEDRLARAAKERDAFVLLRVLRAVLEEEDVTERVARADDRSAIGPCRRRDLPAELVALGDRLLEITL